MREFLVCLVWTGVGALAGAFFASVFHPLAVYLASAMLLGLSLFALVRYDDSFQDDLWRRP